MGPGNQYKYHLCTGSRGGNISFWLLRVAILVFLSFLFFLFFFFLYAAIIPAWELPFCFVAL